MDRFREVLGLLGCLIIASFGTRVAAEDSVPLYKTETRLKDFLLKGYDKTTPPQPVANEPTEIQYSLAIIDIESLDEVKGILTTHVWMRMGWIDQRLTWNTSDYGGLSFVAIPAVKLWRPDIVPYNNAADQYSFDTHFNAIVMSTGSLLFIPHNRIHTMCSVNLQAYPFDQQTCVIKMGSWVYSGNVVSLTRYGGGVDTTDFQPNSVWELVNTTDVINTKYYPCCPEAYPDYTVTIVLRRHSHVLVHMYVGPAVCLGLLFPVIFMLPAVSTYKLILGGSLLIAQVLMMNQLADSLPTSHATAPTVSLYMLANIVLLSLSLACSTVIIYCWERAKRGGTGVPAGIDKVFLGVFGCVLCVKREDYIVNTNTSGAPEGAVNDNAMMTDDSVAMVNEYTRLGAPAEWRQLAVVLDRLLFVIFLVVTITTMAALVKYSY